MKKLDILNIRMKRVPYECVPAFSGTGKSYTGVKLVYLFNKINQQLSREGKGKKTILFCGPSNKSVDHVASMSLSTSRSLITRIVH